MGANLTRDRYYYGYLARDGREHAMRMLDELGRRASTVDAGGRQSPRPPPTETTETRKQRLRSQKREAL
jgi:hypothetical protein